MARPKKGEKGYKEANDKWRASMEKKGINIYDWFADIGRRGGNRGKTGGFASSKVGDDGLTGKERASIAGSKGGKLSRRSKAIVIDGVKYRKDGKPYGGEANMKRMEDATMRFSNADEALKVLEGEE